MWEIRVYNNINAEKKFDQERFMCGLEHAIVMRSDAILVRSEDLKKKELPTSVLAVGRAGIGVDNIDVQKCTEKGIAVFNTPGANANAVKELVLCAMLMSARRIHPALNFLRKTKESNPDGLGKEEIKKLIEGEKKKFKGVEILGKKLFIFGLGNIGRQVARSARALGMDVFGYDPFKKEGEIDVPNLKFTNDKESVSFNNWLGMADYITFHLDLTDETKGLCNKNLLGLMKDGAVIINFSRGGIVTDTDLLVALSVGKISHYASDFITPELQRCSSPDQMTFFPHLGASTAEAEENCVDMICRQISEFLEDGTIVNSVNFPSCRLERNSPYRLTVVNQNKPGMIAKITEVVSKSNINIVEMLNASKGEIGYNILDLETTPSSLFTEMDKLDGVLLARNISRS